MVATITIAVGVGVASLVVGFILGWKAGHHKGKMIGYDNGVNDERENAIDEVRYGGEIYEEANTGTEQ